MAVKSKEEIMNAIKERIGEDKSDEALSLLEDISDTISDYESKNISTDEWKTKYEESEKARKDLDDEWRTKYRERFFSASEENLEGEGNNGTNINTVTETPKTFDELFQTM